MVLRERLLAEIRCRREQPTPDQLGIEKAQALSVEVAENAVLAGCVRNAEYAAGALARLTAVDFDLEWRQQVWGAMSQLHGRGERITSARLYPLLGPVLWGRLAEATANARNPHEHDYIGIVRTFSELRQGVAGMLACIEGAERLPVPAGGPARQAVSIATTLPARG